MAEKKIIAVTGATGAQAGGLARAILDDPSGEFALRTVTRDPGKDAARALVKAASVVAVISRADVADFMLRQLDDRMYLHKAPAVMN
jgi:NmrA-like family